jgi:methyl-accepting chemotaxis protein
VNRMLSDLWPRTSAVLQRAVRSFRESVAFHGVLGPGIRLMRNRRTSQKLLLVFSLVLLPLLLLLYIEGSHMTREWQLQRAGFSAVQEFGALAELRTQVAALSPDLVDTASSGPALAAEATAFEALQVALARGSGPESHQRRKARALQEFEEHRKALRKTYDAAAVESAGLRATRRSLQREYQAAIAALHDAATPVWSVVADADSDAHALFDGGLRTSFYVMLAIVHAAEAGQALLMAPAEGLAQRQTIESSMELRLLLSQLEPAMLAGARRGQLSEAGSEGPLATIQTFADASLKLADRASIEYATADELGALVGGAHGYRQLARSARLAAHTIEQASQAALERHLAAREADRIRLTRIMFGAALLCAGVAAYLLLCTQRVLHKGLKTLCAQIESVGRGNLRRPPKALGQDEIGQAMGALHDAVSSLQQLFDAVTQGVAAVSHASRDVALGNSGLSARTGDMRGAIGNVASGAQGSAMAMDACASVVERASEHARDARANARTGSKSMANLQQRMRSLEARSREINQMVTLMETVTFQTKLLSLNASVEAARAGEAGKGFAVVAQEVRALAERSEKAAGKIRDIVAASVSDIEEGGVLATRANTAVQQTDEQIQAVNALMADVVRLTRDGMQESQNVLGIARTVEASVSGNVQLIDQLSGAAGSLRDQGDALRRSVRHFVLG